MARSRPATATPGALPGRTANRRSSRRTWLTGVLVTGLAFGYLLTTGALDPVLADALTLAEAKLHPAEPAPADPKMQRVVDWQYFDGRPEWSSLRGVPQVSGPAAPLSPTRPAIAPPENPIHFRFNGPPPMPTYSLKGPGACPQPHQPGIEVEQFTATARRQSATATWWDIGDPDTRTYQLVAVPDLVNVGNGTRVVVEPPQVRTTLNAPHACKEMTATVTGLISGQTYYLQLQALNDSNVNTGQHYGVVRAQSQNFKAL